MVCTEVSGGSCASKCSLPRDKRRGGGWCGGVRARPMAESLNFRTWSRRQAQHGNGELLNDCGDTCRTGRPFAVQLD